MCERGIPDVIWACELAARLLSQLDAVEAAADAAQAWVCMHQALSWSPNRQLAIPRPETSRTKTHLTAPADSRAVRGGGCLRREVGGDPTMLACAGARAKGHMRCRFVPRGTREGSHAVPLRAKGRAAHATQAQAQYASPPPIPDRLSYRFQSSTCIYTAR
eukprot:1264986-Rhodomonas_salina.1